MKTISGQSKVTRARLASSCMAIAVVVAGSYLPVVQAANKSYLDQLSQEVDKGGAMVDGSSAAPDSSAKSVKPEPTITVDKDASLAEFEEALATDHQSTFNLYSKLDDEKRSQVFADYQEKGDWGSVTRKVLKLLYGI